MSLYMCILLYNIKNKFDMTLIKMEFNDKEINEAA